jgi:hypothetical protein
MPVELQTWNMANGLALSMIYNVIQEERSVFREVIVLVIVRKKIHINMCLILNIYQEGAIWTYKYKSNMNDHKEELITVKFILILLWCLNDNFVTVHNKCLKIPPSSSVHFDNLCGRITFCSSELIFTILYVNSGIQNASKQFVSGSYLPFVNFALHPNPQTKI